MKTKKIYRSIIAFIILAAIFTSSVSAVVYTAEADDLKSLGLFLGTDTGYELDRSPTRVEAAVMLIRLLGKEAEAKEKNFAHPFTDVPAWADLYIGYMYEKGLTVGIGNNLYGSGDCTAQMFCTFVLRSLGYADIGDNADFTYAGAVDFAMEIGIIDDEIMAYFTDGIFNRDCCVAIMCKALGINIKGTETTLLEKLVAEGAVDAEAAAAFTAKFYLIGNGDENEIEPELSDEDVLRQELVNELIHIVEALEIQFTVDIITLGVSAISEAVGAYSDRPYALSNLMNDETEDTVYACYGINDMPVPEGYTELQFAFLFAAPASGGGIHFIIIQAPSFLCLGALYIGNSAESVLELFNLNGMEYPSEEIVCETENGKRLVLNWQNENNFNIRYSTNHGSVAVDVRDGNIYSIVFDIRELNS